MKETRMEWMGMTMTLLRLERVYGYIYTGTYLYVLVETCVLMSE